MRPASPSRVEGWNRGLGGIVLECLLKASSGMTWPRTLGPSGDRYLLLFLDSSVKELLGEKSFVDMEGSGERLDLDVPETLLEKLDVGVEYPLLLDECL